MTHAKYPPSSRHVHIFALLHSVFALTEWWGSRKKFTLGTGGISARYGNERYSTGKIREQPVPIIIFCHVWYEKLRVLVFYMKDIFRLLIKNILRLKRFCYRVHCIVSMKLRVQGRGFMLEMNNAGYW